MSTNDISLPDQAPDPDWSDVRYYAEAWLRQEAIGRDDTDFNALIAVAALQALYGPHVEEFTRELRKRYDIED